MSSCSSARPNAASLEAAVAAIATDATHTSAPANANRVPSGSRSGWPRTPRISRASLIAMAACPGDHVRGSRASLRATNSRTQSRATELGAWMNDQEPAAREEPAGRASVDVDVGDLDGVVSVAEPVPRRDLGLHVPGRVGSPGSERVPSDVVRVPVEGPVLPLIGAFGGLELRLVPVTFAGEADVDLGHGSGSRPGF